MCVQGTYYSIFGTTSPTKPYKSVAGRLAQLVERTLSMREVEGSKPSLSTIFYYFYYHASSYPIPSLPVQLFTFSTRFFRVLVA